MCVCVLFVVYLPGQCNDSVETDSAIHIFSGSTNFLIFSNRVAMEEVSDEQTVSDVAALFLSAAELVALRKPADLPPHKPVGEKWYFPNDSDAEKEVISAMLEERKALLEMKRTARLGDLMKAEWDADLQKAVAEKLKGKFTQHVGRSSGGKILLSPEEAVFLIECGYIEVCHKGMPLSTQEAYSVILSSEASHLRYRVYAHLSKLGFTVVMHQGNIDFAPSHEKNTGKQKLKGKRKKSGGDRPRKKANIDQSRTISENSNLTSSNNSAAELEGNAPADAVQKSVIADSAAAANNQFPISDQIEKTDDLSEKGEPVESDANPRIPGSSGESETTKAAQDKDLPESSTSLASDVCSESAKKLSKVGEVDNKIQQTNVASDNVSQDDVEMEDLSQSGKDMPDSEASREEGKSSSEVTVSVTSSEPNEREDRSEALTIDYEKTESGIKMVAPSSSVISQPEQDSSVRLLDDSTKNSKNQSESTLSQKPVSETGSKSVDSDSDTVVDGGENVEAVEPFDSEVVTSEDCHIVVDVAEKSEVLAVQPSKEECLALEIRADGSTSGSSEEEDVDADEDRDADEDVDVNEDEYESGSEYTSEDSIVRVDTENDSMEGTDEVIVLDEVAKEEPKPLAVINLLSDDEDDQSESGDDSEDDEIQFIEEKRPPASSSSSQGSSEPREMKPEIPSQKYRASKVDVGFNESTTWPFPYVLKKTVVCLPRPPPHLLPPTVRLSKEAYTLDLRKLGGATVKPTQRVWNSYKDLMAARKGNYGSSSFRGSPWNIPPDRSLSPDVHNVSPGPPSGGGGGGQVFHDQRNRMIGSSQASSSFIRFEDPNRNSPLLPYHPPSSPFVKAEFANQATPPHFRQPRPPPPLLRSPQDQFSHMVNLAATQAAVQAARNVIMSMTRSLNMPMNGHSSAPFTGGMPFNSNFQFPGGDIGGLMGPPEMSLINNQRPKIGRDMSSVPDSTTDFHDAAHFPNSMQFPDQRTTQFHNDVYAADSGGFPGASSFESNQENSYRQVGMNSNIRANRFNSSFNDGDPFPSVIPRGPRKAGSWREYKSAVGGPANSGDNVDPSGDDDDDICEIPINNFDVLWSKDLCPLVRSESNEVSDIMKCAQITLSANLLKGSFLNSRTMPTSSSLEIAFDVYLPKVPFKKTCPRAPNHRIVVVSADDLFPKLGDIVFLARKFRDSATLTLAVVDEKDISFFSFNFVSLPKLLPQENSED